MISTDSVVAAVKEQFSADLIDEMVALDARSGRYFGFQSVAARIWQMLQQPHRVSAICEAVLDEYEVSAVECERDLLAFLEELSSNGLIEVQHAQDA